MKRALTLLALLLIGGLAYVVRVQAGSARVATASEVAEVGTRWPIDDANTAGHLRRIELAIAAKRLPRSDRWLAHLQGGEVPWLPLYDTALAAVSEHFAGASTSRGSPVAASSIEDVALSAPPWLGVLAVLAVAWAVRGMVRGRGASVAMLLAALLCAFAPATIRSSALGHLDSSAWLALLAALQIGLAARAVSAREPLDAIFGALLAGLVSGVALASSIAGGALFVGAWSGFAVRAFAAADGERSLAQRAGLSFCAVAALVGQLPLADGPWQGSGSGLLSAWSVGVSQCALFAAAPFLVGSLLRSRTRGRAFSTALLAVVLGLLAFYLPDTVGKLRRAISALAAWHASSSSFVAAPRSWNDALEALTPAALLSLPLAALLARGWRRPENTLLFVLALTTLALAVVEPPLVALFVVPMACTLAYGVARGLEASSIRRQRVTQALCVLGVVGLVFSTVDLWRDARADDARSERIELVRGLRWMREQTPSAGAFNAASVPGAYAVLCTPGIASLVVYHARRPTLASPFVLVSDAESLNEIGRVLTGVDAEHLARVMHTSQARYLVTGPRCLREFAALEAAAASSGVRGSEQARAGESSLLWILSMTPASDRADPVPGLTRVYASALSVGIDGRAVSSGADSGPAISIWRLDAAPQARARAELRAR